MSDADDPNEQQQPFSIEKAKTGRAACKKCKEKCARDELRMSRVLDNPFGSGKMHQWYHVDCLLASFKTQRATSRAIESLDDILGWSALGDLQRDAILEKLQTLDAFRNGNQTTEAGAATDAAGAAVDANYRADSEDNLFRTFCSICERLADESSYLAKTAILQKMFLKGSNGQRFEGKVYVWMRLLLPNVDKRVYNLQSRQLIKLFARIFAADPSDMMAHLEQGDVSETIRTFFERWLNQKAAGRNRTSGSTLSLDTVDARLDELTLLSKEDEQVAFFRTLCTVCTLDDLKMIIRFIKHDLRINAGAKHVLGALGADAYVAYQSSRDLCAVVQRFSGNIIAPDANVTTTTSMAAEPDAGRRKQATTDGIQLMTPISPMLAEACKSVERAIVKCPDGMYSEIKYDGERIQLHKRGDEFRFFSRNLKPVPAHKTIRCVEFVPQAFPDANDLILDAEILMVDTNTDEMLPFGTLGKHKRTAFASAEVCLFVFDCVYYNGENLTKKPLKERRAILEQNIRPIRHHVQLSEYHLITKSPELSAMIAKVLQMGLEGLVLKNVNGAYEPGKRHWLKVKKDYLFDGQMADAADLVVLGAWFGTGKMGGILSVYLMGSWDERTRCWCTVTKVHTGFDERTASRVHKQLQTLTQRHETDAPLPAWLNCARAQVPDMIARDPVAMPVWEITGAEFTQSNHHTANGISIRFPRITRQRDDKTAAQATTVTELQRLVDASKEGANLHMLLSAAAAVSPSDGNELKIQTKMKTSPTKTAKCKVEADAAPNKRSSRECVDDESSKKRLKLRRTTDDTSASSIQCVGGVGVHDTKKKAASTGRKTRAFDEPPKNAQYKYRDSSDDDDDDGGFGDAGNAFHKRKLCDAISKESSIPTADNCNETKASKRDLKAKTNSPTAKQMAAAATAASSSSSSSHAAVDVPTAAPNNTISIIRAASSGSAAVGRTARKPTRSTTTPNIFEGVVLCVENDVRDRIREELRYFQLWGGRVVVAGAENAVVPHAVAECTHALHAEASVRCADWTALRERYATHCRHVQLDWLTDAIRAKELKPAEAYPVALIMLQ